MDPAAGSMIPNDLVKCYIGSMIPSDPIVKFTSESWITLDRFIAVREGSWISDRIRDENYDSGFIPTILGSDRIRHNSYFVMIVIDEIRDKKNT